MRKIYKILCLMLVAGVAACSSGDEDGVFGWGGNRSANSQIYTISSTGGVYKIGNPYVIFGTTYYPKEDYNYSEVGIASWYGSDFHAKSTANGEKYDMNSLTAAHRTLPLPSIVKVTNLENGRSVILRVNDRGPYAKNRIIDISKKGAEILGFCNQGTTRVKVEVMAEESKKLKEAMLKKAGGDAWMKANGSVAKTSSTVASSGGMKYIQAGSFTSKDTAYNLKNQLEQFGTTFVSSAVVDKAQYYRVKVGPFKTAGEAELALRKIKDYGIVNAKFVSN